MSIWFTKVFIGAVLRKNGRWMGTLSEEVGDGGFSFSVWKRHIIICSKVHAILSDLPFYRSVAKLGPARKFAVDSVSNAPGSAACCCGLPAHCNCHLENYDPLLFMWDLMRSPKFILSKNLLFGYILRGRFRQLFNGPFDVLKRFVVEVPA